MTEMNPELQPQQGAQVGERDSWLQQLNEQIGTATANQERDVQGAVQALCASVLEDQKLIGRTAAATIEKTVAQLDAKLTAQINEILHNPTFQKLEGTWRGLHRLVSSTESGPDLKIKFLSIGKDELQETLDDYPGTKWDQSPIFEKIYGPYDRIGDVPVGCVVGDYAFDHSGSDVRLMGQMAKIASAAHAPFLAGASPSICGFKEEAGGWRQLEQVQPKDIAAVFEPDDYAAWRDFRKTEDSRYVGLAMPRFLARMPWGSRGEQVKDFAFEEFAEDEPESFSNPNRYVWANAAYAMAMNVTRAFKDYGWCSRIRGVKSGGLVTELPTYVYPSEGATEMACPTELSMGDRREKALADAGFMPLEHIIGTGNAVFKGAQSAQLPKKFGTKTEVEKTATENAALGARLPYLLAASRFAHYLKCMVRDWVGTFKEADELRSELQNWINRYVLANPSTANEQDKALQPLAEASVEVEPIAGDPGAYSAVFRIRPHYQLEKVDVQLSLVSRLKKK